MALVKVMHSTFDFSNKQRLLHLKTCVFCYIKITICFNYNIYFIPQVKLDLCVADLEKIKGSSNSCHLQKLNEVLAPRL